MPDLDDDAFLDAIATGRLPAAAFGHREHLRFAWLQLRRAPLQDAIPATCDGIARFAAHHGAHGKFHHTVSEAMLRLMAHGGAADPALDWTAFAARNPRLFTDARGVLARHYSPEVLASDAARHGVVAPDRDPLPA